MSTTFTQPAVPMLFTRAAAPTFWPSDGFVRPLNPFLRRQRDLKALTEALPPLLTTHLRKRFRSHLLPGRRWQAPPALPSSSWQGYPSARLNGFSEQSLYWEVGIQAGFIDRLLDAPEEAVGGLSHNYLLSMQMLRLRQLWEEVNRRAWAEPPLVVFVQAMGA